MIRSIAQTTNLRPVPPLPDALRQARTVLVVEAAGALRFLERNPMQQGVVMTHMRMLNLHMLAQIAPDAVIGPLIGPGWDSLDLGIALEELGYEGTFYILTRPLPRAELVLRELRGCCPTLTIKLIETA
ncbi:MAG: hypothetical protein JJU15_00780 [Pararhodobacter sp.]|nr:hypothetical protein [Pararhodobacter sp.]